MNRLVKTLTISLSCKPNSKLSQTTIPGVLSLFYLDNDLSVANRCSSLSINLMGLLNITKQVSSQKVSPSMKALTIKKPSHQ
jgi:hypothetical protein